MEILGRLRAPFIFGRPLILEEVIEGSARAVGSSRPFAGGFFFQGHAHGIERTVVATVFRGDTLWNGLIALKAAGWIEVFALLAGVKFESAFCTWSEGLGIRLQDGSALSAAGHRAGPGHVQRARPVGIVVVLARGSGLRFGPLLRLATGILIAVLTVFRQNLHP
jgi:hypothetical protein